MLVVMHCSRRGGLALIQPLLILVAGAVVALWRVQSGACSTAAVQQLSLQKCHISADVEKLQDLPYVCVARYTVAHMDNIQCAQEWLPLVS